MRKKQTVSDLRITKAYTKVFNDFPYPIMLLTPLFNEAQRQINNGADDAALETTMLMAREKYERETR